MNFFVLLPVEILSFIFQFIDIFLYRNTLSLVCKEWYFVQRNLEEKEYQYFLKNQNSFILPKMIDLLLNFIGHYIICQCHPSGNLSVMIFEEKENRSSPFIYSVPNVNVSISNILFYSVEELDDIRESNFKEFPSIIESFLSKKEKNEYIICFTFIPHRHHNYVQTEEMNITNNYPTVSLSEGWNLYLEDILTSLSQRYKKSFSKKIFSILYQETKTNSFNLKLESIYNLFLKKEHFFLCSRF